MGHRRFGAHHARARQSERARSLIADAAVRAEKNGRGELLATIKSTVGLAGFGRGRLEEARGALQASKELALAYGLDQVERIAEVNLGRCHVELGEHDATKLALRAP